MKKCVLGVLFGLHFAQAAVLCAGEGDSCTQPYVVNLPGGGMPYQHAGSICGRGNDVSSTCLAVLDDGDDVFYKLVLSRAMALEVMVTGGACAGVALLNACPPEGQCIVMEIGVGMQLVELNAELTAGTYYLLLDAGPAPNCVGYELAITELPPPAPGDSCGNPLVIQVPADLPYTVEGATTCARHDFVNAGSCLAEFSFGEEAVYRLHVTAATEVDIHVEPHGTPGVGLMVDTECPPTGSCLASVKNFATIALGINGLFLPAGDYTLIVDVTTPLPCVPAYDLEVMVSTAPHGACCIGDTCAGTWSHLTCSAAGGRWFSGWPCDGFACPELLSILPETCATAYELPGAPYTARLHSGAAGPGPPAGSCNNPSVAVMQNDIWFTFVSTGEPVTLGMEYFYNGITAAYTGADCNNLTELVCVDSSYDLPDVDTADLSVPAGERVWIQVGDFGVAPGGGEVFVALIGGAAVIAGDANCDGEVDFGDINPFVLLLANPATWQLTHPGCSLLVGDTSGNGAVGFEDINLFVALLAGGS